jgi:hypothetical protein
LNEISVIIYLLLLTTELWTRAFAFYFGLTW